MPASPTTIRDLQTDGVERVVAVGLVASAVIAVLALVVLLGAHLGDAFGVDHASGVWMALAAQLRDGQLYPVLFDGEHFGGARYMPGPIGLYALAGELVGDPLVGLKLVDLLAVIGLAAVLFVVLRRRDTPAPLAIGLVAGLLVTQAGLMSATGRSEAIPAVLQLGAIGLVLVAPPRRAAIPAATLCVLGVLCKVVALYAPIAIGLWLLWVDRAAFVRFALVFAVGLVGALAVLHLVSEGRMAANFLEVSVSGIRPGTILRAPLQLVEQVIDGLQSTLILLPFVLLAAISALVRRSIGLAELALVVALAILLVVMTDTGAAYNHHLDVAVLVTLVVAELAVSAGRDLERRTVAVIGCAVIVGTAAALAVNVVPSLPGALAGSTAPEDDPHPLAGVIAPGASILSEDPTVPVTLGERPVILDPVMLLRFQTSHPDWTASLVARIEAGEFEHIVLLRDLDAPGADEWYREWHLGTAVEAAIRGAYRLDETVGRYHLYAPIREG